MLLNLHGKNITFLPYRISSQEFSLTLPHQITSYSDDFSSVYEKFVSSLGTSLSSCVNSGGCE